MRIIYTALLAALFVFVFMPRPSHAQAVDLNDDGVFDQKDILLLVDLIKQGNAGGNVNGDGQVDFLDLFAPAANFGDPVPTPTPPGDTPTPTPTLQDTPTPTPTGTPEPPTATPTPGNSTDRTIRDYWPMNTVGNHWFMVGKENIGNFADDFDRTITDITANGIEFFTHTTTNDMDELQEFYDVFTPSGDLAIKEVRLETALPIPPYTVPPQTIPLDPPLVIAGETVTSDWTSTSTTNVTVNTGSFPPSISGNIVIEARVVEFDMPVVITPDGGGADVTFPDTITIEYKATVNVPGFGVSEFFRPLSAILTLANGVGPVRAQEFLDKDTPGEIFYLVDGLVDGVSYP